MFYARPNRATQVMNRLFGWLASVGLTPKDTVRLEVRGRKSGETRSVAVTSVEHEGQRYLVSPRGESEWVRNARAAGGEAELRHGKAEAVRLEELPAGERAAIIQAYLKKTQRATGQHFGVKAEAGIEEFEGIASRHPVFRVVIGG